MPLQISSNLKDGSMKTYFPKTHLLTQGALNEIRGVV